MELEFDKAKWTVDMDGAWFSVRIDAPRLVTAWIEGMQDSKTYVAKLAEKHKRRSVDANAYYWVLCGALARALDREPEEIYRHHIRGLGNYAVYGMQEEAVEMFSRLWVSGHLGRMIETKAAKTPGIVNVLAYYGSSDFDGQQMRRLIDHAVQDCQALGIETRPPEEVESLLAQWDAQSDKRDKHSAKGQGDCMGA